MLTLYHARTAVCPIKVRLVLAEKQLEWSGHELDLRAGDQASPEYLRLNPKAVVPTLIHDGKLLTESSIIMQYLDDLAPTPALQPHDPYERAQMRLWMKFADEVVHPANVTLVYATVHRKHAMARTAAEREAMFSRVPDPERRLRQRHAIEQGLDAPEAKLAARAAAACLRQMDKALAEHDWLASGTWTLADAALTPYIDRLDRLGLACLWRDAFPRIDEWLVRIRARPSYDEAVRRFSPAADVAIDEDEIRQFAALARDGSVASVQEP